MGLAVYKQEKQYLVTAELAAHKSRIHTLAQTQLQQRLAYLASQYQFQILQQYLILLLTVVVYLNENI